MTTESDIAEILQLKYRYVRSGDVHDWDLLRSTLTDDFHGDFGNGFTVTSADPFVDGQRTTRGRDNITVHKLHQPEIEVDGDTASGLWLLSYRAVRKTSRVLVEGAGHYRDSYRRTEHGWRISRVELRRLYETEISFDDVPSLRLTADHLGD